MPEQPAETYVTETGTRVEVFTELCECTNDQLERGETCGLPQCPNAPRG